MKTLQVRKGSTDTLHVYPPMEAAVLAQPSAADLRLGTVASGLTAEGSELTGVVDETDTTIASEAERGARTLALTSAADVVAGRLFLAETEGKKFVLYVIGKSGNTVYLGESLAETIPAAATFKGLVSTYQLSTTHTASIGAGLAKWRLTLGGVIVPVDHYFEVVEAIFPITLTPARLLRRPEIQRRRDPTHSTLLELILAAWEDELMPRLRASGLDEEHINSPAEIEPAHIEACILLQLRGGNADLVTVEDQERRLDRKIADAKASTKLQIDRSEANVIAKPNPGSIDRTRFTRIYR